MVFGKTFGITLCAAAMAAAGDFYRRNLTDFMPRDSTGIIHPADYAQLLDSALGVIWKNGGGTLEINPGRYKLCNDVEFTPPTVLNQAVRPTITISGAGGGDSRATTFYCDGIFNDNSNNLSMFRFKSYPDRVYSVRIEHLSLEGSQNTWSSISALNFEDIPYFHANDLYIHDFNMGIRSTKNRYNVENCTIQSMRRHAIFAEGGDAFIQRNDFEDIGEPGSVYASTLYIWGDVVVSNNIFGSSQNAAIRVKGGGDLLSITNNEFDRNKYIVILEPHATINSNILFSGNKVVLWNGVDGWNPHCPCPVGSGFVNAQAFQNLMIKDNHFSGLSEGGFGFDLADGKNAQITGNTFEKLYMDGAWQPLLGEMFRLQNVENFLIRGNSMSLGGYNQGVPIKPIVGKFYGSNGIFAENFLEGLGQGFRYDAAARVTIMDNKVKDSDLDMVRDDAGYITLPDQSSVVLNNHIGGGALRKGRISKKVGSSIPNNSIREVLRFKLPLPTSQNPTAPGSILKVRVHVRGVNGGGPAQFEKELSVSQVPAGSIIASLGQTQEYDPHGIWGTASFTLSPGSNNQEKVLNLQVSSPNSSYSMDLSVEYEDWGSIQIK